MTKKFYPPLLVLLGLLFSVNVMAALTPITSEYTFIAQTAMNGNKVSSKTNYDTYIKSVSISEHAYVENRGKSTINGKECFNCMQIKSGRGISFMVGKAFKLTIYSQAHGSRAFTLGTKADGTDIKTFDVNTSVNTIELGEQYANKTIYLSAPGDIYLAGLKFEEIQSGEQTQYTKPTITQGAYNRENATYSITFSTQNDEVGTINYTIGNNEKVTGVESGTTVANVPVNTTITATVSGDKYKESAEATLTTSAMPTLATPTYSIGSYDFINQLYTVSLAATEGATIKYTVDGEQEYSEAFTVAPNTTVTAYAVQENMTNSKVLSFTTPAAPTDGSHTTPTISGTYTDGMIYDAGAYTITNNPNYIGGQISSGTTSINGAIKMRISRQADPKDFADKYGFHIDVNKGYTITSVKLQMFNNYADTENPATLTGVYADDATSQNLLTSPVKLEKATKEGTAAVAEVTGIEAKERIVFVFEGSETLNPNQAQILITVNYIVPEVINVNKNVGYATMYYEKELKVPADTKAYTAELKDNKLVLTELTDGIIPAKTAVLVSGNGGVFEASNTGAKFSGTNDLKGTATEIETSAVTGGTVCTLGYEDNVAAFYKYAGTTLAANKAYLVVPAASGNAKAISIVFNDNATGVNTVAKAEDNANATIYNIAGQRVTKNAKGIVIVNGKAYINK